MAPVPEPTRIHLPPPTVPRGACDCHVHVFDPRFPFTAHRAYTPGPASVAELEAMLARLGVERVVLVQASVYGSDNACLLAALEALGPRARAVVEIDPDRTGDAELARLHAAGARAVRVNLESRNEKRADAARAAFAATVERVAGHGFAVQIYADLAVLETLAPAIAAAPVPVILDHYAGAKAASGLAQPGFAALLDLLATGTVWVKLSAPYRASTLADHADLAPIARALIAARPDRLVWASDWPHTGGGAERARRGPYAIEPFRPVDDAAALAELAHWCGDAPTFARIMAENPACLFDFPLPSETDCAQ